MKTSSDGETLSISDVRELGVANAVAFRDEARAALKPEQRNIEIDLSRTAFIDSCGLGALIHLHKTACGRHGLLRLRNPAPQVLQVLELTRMHRIFEIIHN